MSRFRFQVYLGGFLLGLRLYVRFRSHVGRGHMGCRAYVAFRVHNGIYVLALGFRVDIEALNIKVLDIDQKDRFM